MHGSLYRANRRLQQRGNRKLETARLFQKLANKGVLAGNEIVKRTIKDQASFGEHEERCGGMGLTLRKRDHAALIGVEYVGTHGECVLKTMRYQQRGGVVDVALFDDEFDNGGGGNGVQASGGRVVENQIGIVDEG